MRFKKGRSIQAVHFIHSHYLASPHRLLSLRSQRWGGWGVLLCHSGKHSPSKGATVTWLQHVVTAGIQALQCKSFLFFKTDHLDFCTNIHVLKYRQCQ